MKSKILYSLYPLSPLLVFFILFIGSGLYFSLTGQQYGFYQVSASVAILPAIILALYNAREPFQKGINIFLEGARDNNIIIMCLIYLLAGAFATVLHGIGGITSTVNFVLHYVPIQATLPALFLVSALISTAMGTSMGTLAAAGPIGAALAQSVGIPLPLTMGTLIGGAMFGDNLSMISDTSIAATQIHGCTVSEKFKNNAVIALPAMIITVLILTVIGYEYTNVTSTTIEVGDYQILHCLPYLVVLGFALSGTNVFIVLVVGIISAAIIGILTVPSYNIITLSKNIFEGYKSMTEILILSLLMGGLGELIKHNGGFNIFNQILSYFARRENNIESTASIKIAEAAISSIASFSDVCTANNTAAIILSGKATKEIAVNHQVPAARAATLVDLFSCVFQGILPYSAQVLMAGSLSGISPISIIPYVHYCYLLGIMGLVAIFFQFPRFSLKRTTTELNKSI